MNLILGFYKSLLKLKMSVRWIIIYW